MTLRSFLKKSKRLVRGVFQVDAHDLVTSTFETRAFQIWAAIGRRPKRPKSHGNEQAGHRKRYRINRRQIQVGVGEIGHALRSGARGASFYRPPRTSVVAATIGSPNALRDVWPG